MLKRLLGLCLASALSACDASHTLDATFSGHQVQFTSAKHGTGCFDYFAVKNESGAFVWEIEGPHSKRPCASRLPITYGVLPAGMKQLTPPAELILGQGYSIIGTDDSPYHGYFKLRPVIRIDNDPEAGQRTLFQGVLGKHENLVPLRAGGQGSKAR